MREAKLNVFSENFRVNPNSLKSLPLKPTALDPNKLVEEAHAGIDAKTLADPTVQQLNKTLADALRTPQEKSPWAVTTSQEYGW